jgi:hypothetical protein
MPLHQNESSEQHQGAAKTILQLIQGKCVKDKDGLFIAGPNIVTSNTLALTERGELTSDSHELDLYVEKTSSTHPTCLRVTTSITVNTMEGHDGLDNFYCEQRTINL